MNRPADLDVTRAPDPKWTRLSVIWIVPLLALLVSLGVAWKTYAERGVLVQVLFQNATGITAGQTVLKYREVEVGRVEQVGFTDDLQQVTVSVRVDRDIAPYLDEDAHFWIVQPEVSARGISRLDTVLSGVFIEGTWDSDPGTAQTRFTARADPPVLRRGQDGTAVVLRAEDGGTLSDGAPVLFRGLEVGTVQNLRLDPGGGGVIADAFIQAPHDARLSTATVFWDVSGFAVSLGAEGLRLDVRSLGALVQGGVEFATFSSGGRPLQAEQEFRLHPDRQTARESLLDEAPEARVALSTLLQDSVRGLTEGANVLYRGQPVGRITDLSLQIVEDGANERAVFERVDFTISPGKLGLRPDASVGDVLTLLEDQVAQGLRARIASQGLFGGELVLELATLDQPGTMAGPAGIDRRADPHPMLPSAPTDIADLQATAEGVFARINALPIEELLGSATTLMREATGLITRDGTQQTPDEALALLSDLRTLINSPEVTETPAALRATLTEAQALLADLRAAKLDLALTSAINATSEAATTVSAAAAGVPDLVATLDAVAAEAARAPLRETVSEAQSVLSRLDTLLGTEETAALPGRLGSTLTELTAVLADLRAGGAVENVNAALASARDAAGAVSTASGELPALVTRLDSAITEITATLAAYGERSAFNSETVATMRELRRAAEAVGSLARTLERNPNSLLLGR